MENTTILNSLTSGWGLVILLAILWTIPWKGVALWKAAGDKDLIWFIVIFLLNTLAVLEIIYIFFISKKRASPIDSEESVKELEKKIMDIQKE